MNLPKSFNNNFVPRVSFRFLKGGSHQHAYQKAKENIWGLDCACATLVPMDFCIFDNEGRRPPSLIYQKGKNPWELGLCACARLSQTCGFIYRYSFKVKKTGKKTELCQVFLRRGYLLSHSRPWETSKLLPRFLNEPRLRKYCFRELR